MTDEKKRNPGHPRVHPAVRRDKRAYVALSEEELARLDEEAATLGVSRYELLRRKLFSEHDEHDEYRRGFLIGP
jgi:hypothetical protein